MKFVLLAANRSCAHGWCQRHLGGGAREADVGDNRDFPDCWADGEDVIRVLVRGCGSALDTAHYFNGGSISDSHYTTDFAGRGAGRTELDAVTNRERSTASDGQRGVGRTKLPTLVNVGG